MALTVTLSKLKNNVHVTQSLDSFVAHFREVFGCPFGDLSVSDKLYDLS